MHKLQVNMVHLQFFEGFFQLFNRAVPFFVPELCSNEEFLTFDLSLLEKLLERVANVFFIALECGCVNMTYTLFNSVSNNAI